MFYTNPRLVVHIDDEAIATVSRIFQSFVPARSTVLDLMSSWRSHWPQGHLKERLVGLGMNAQEMAEDPHYKARGVHVEWEDQQLGKTVKGIGVVPRFSKTPGKIWRGSVPVGYDNELVYCDLLGLGAQALQDLSHRGVI